MKQSNAFLAVTGLVSAVILVIFALSVLDFAGPEQKEAASSTLTPLERPTVGVADPALGEAAAPLTIVVFGDFMCEACAAMSETLANLVADRPQDVRLVWKDAINERLHPGAKAAAVAARCAWQQGAFWTYHAYLMANSGQVPSSSFQPVAVALGLDGEEFTDCLAADRTAPLVERATEEAARLGLVAVPTVFVGERRVEGLVSYDQLSAIVDAELSRLGGGQPAPADNP
jgi:protein-disulfide isomerase